MSVATAAPAPGARWKIILAVVLAVAAVGLFVWHFTREHKPPPVAPKVEDQATRLKQELLLLEQQQQPPPEPEPETPVEPTRAARKAK